MAEESLYERVGGQAAIDAVVEQFYERVFADPELRPYFEHSPLEKLVAMQKEFFAAALGGPVAYSGTGLRDVHGGRGIGVAQLTLFTEHLLETLQDAEFPQDASDEVVRRISMYADDVLGGTNESG